MIAGYYVTPCECGASQDYLHLGREGDACLVRCGKCGRKGNPEMSESAAIFSWNDASRGYLLARENPMLKKRKYHDPYFVVINEWLYPTESGHSVEGTYLVYENALNRCKEECEKELFNYADVCECDPLRPAAECGWDGVPQKFIITAKNGLDEWWFASRIIEVEHGT